MKLEYFQEAPAYKLLLPSVSYIQPKLSRIRRMLFEMLTHLEPGYIWRYNHTGMSSLLDSSTFAAD